MNLWLSVAYFELLDVIMQKVPVLFSYLAIEHRSNHHRELAQLGEYVSGETSQLSRK